MAERNKWTSLGPRGPDPSRVRWGSTGTGETSGVGDDCNRESCVGLCPPSDVNLGL